MLDWQEDELDRMAGSDWKKREACKMAAWIKPKMSHKSMVQKLLQVRAHVILCFRAEEKVEMVREDGKMKIVPKQGPTGLHGWMPVCEKNLPFELTCSFLLTADAPGYPKPIKLQEQHRALFPLDKHINEQSGKLVAAWASGKTSAPPPPHTPADSSPVDAGGAVGAETDNQEVYTRIREALKLASASVRARFEIKTKGYPTVDDIPFTKALTALAWIKEEVDRENSK